MLKLKEKSVSEAGSQFLSNFTEPSRRAAIDVYCKRSATQGESAEMTFEQLQKQVGIGVNPGD